MAATTQGKKKRPPTLHFLPKVHAKRLKKSWVEGHKIRSKWKAQKRREGLTNHLQTSTQVGDTSKHLQDEANADSGSDTSPSRPDKPPISSPPPSHDKQSLRNLRRLAYASKPFHTQKAVSSRRDGTAPVGRETGQPNMKLRMDVLLEKIKRDLS